MAPTPGATAACIARRAAEAGGRIGEMKRGLAAASAEYSPSE